MSEKKTDNERLKRKEAARTWYNLLTELWPPENTEEYWQRVSERSNEILNEHQDNLLLKELLVMTYGYLGKVVKGGKEEG